MSYIVPHFIAGKHFHEINENSHILHNPATGEKIGQVHFASNATCSNIIKTAKEAWPAWSCTTPMKRSQILFKFRDLLEKNQLDLARIITKENGKTHNDAKGSIARAIEVVEYHCGIITQLQGTYSANVSSDVDCYTIRQPLGVCAGISPFNFPVMVPIWMIIPAIACGNTFILKPSEQDPSASVRLCELLSDAGLPPGVVNCIQGDANTVNQLLIHPDIKAITAVASSAVAKDIYTKAINNNKRAHTFGGAKNHCVVMPNADLDQTAKAIVGAAFGSAGERCMAISVVVAVGNITANQLIERMTPLIKKITINEGNDSEVEIGPLISSSHRAQVIDAINQGVVEGANLIIDGRKFIHPKYPEGFFLSPCLFDEVTEKMSIYQKELFGPVLAIVRVNNLNEAITLVNKHQYGNGTTIFTSDGYSAREYIQKVQVGMVGVNIPIPVPIANHPFGGWKSSSFGDHQMHGTESINFYTKPKTVTSKWLWNKGDDNAFNMPQNG